MKNLVFFGSDNYSAITLNYLIASKKFNIILVVTDHQKIPLAVEKLAIEQNLNTSYYPTNSIEMINLVNLLQNLKKEGELLGLCASFDHLVPSEIIEIFTDNLYNLHPSLLPQYRNVSPVQYAIAMGDTTTGITLFRISVGIDNGAIISQVKEDIGLYDTTSSLTPRLFQRGAELFINGLSNNFHSQKMSNPVTNQKLIFTRRLTRESGYIEWENLAKLIKNQEVNPSMTKNELLQLRLSQNPSGNILSDLIRSLSPWPTVWSLLTSVKGELRISLELKEDKVMIKIAGKPNSISYQDFDKYYLH